MTAHTYSGPGLNTNTAELRQWAGDLSAALTTVGLPKTADTGQINTSTITWSATINFNYGYEIRYLNDSLHGTKPCYIKIEYANGGLNSRTNIIITCGTGTDGAGNISGVMFTRNTSVTYQSTIGGGSWPTYLCVREGYFMIAWLRGAYSGSGMMFFAITRTCDSSGTPTTDGFNFWYASNGSPLTRKTYLTSELTDGNFYGFWPTTPVSSSSSLISGSIAQTTRTYSITNGAIQVCPFCVLYLNSEIPAESTFSVTPVGATARTMLALGFTGGYAYASPGYALNNTYVASAFQYE